MGSAGLALAVLRAVAGVEVAAACSTFLAEPYLYINKKNNKKEPRKEDKINQKKRCEAKTHLWSSIVLCSTHWSTIRDLGSTLRIGVCEAGLMDGLAEDRLLVTFGGADDVELHVHYTFAWFDVAIHGHVLRNVVDLAYLQCQQALTCFTWERG